jgi:diguanylate cyclase (GGDEF)-like protein/PAS domain S-box-containing protein
VAVVHSARVARVRKDGVAVVLAVDGATTAMTGFAAEAMVGRRSLDFIHPDDQDRAVDCWMRMLAEPAANHRVRLRHARADGSWLWVEIANRNLLDSPGDGYVEAEMLDVSDEMAAQEALRAREQLLDRLAQALPLGIFQVDLDRSIRYSNELLHHILGTAGAASLEEQLAGVVADDLPVVEHALASALRDGVDTDVEASVLAGGGQRLCRFGVRALSSEQGDVTGAIVCVADVTESATLRVQLEHRATFDALTGCHNRASAMAALESTLRSPAHAGAGTAAIFIDLDRFKPVNDRLGHAAGDALLHVVAERLRSVVRGADLVGRFGGDEFLAVCPGVGDHREALRIAERMATVVAQDVEGPWGRLDVRASIGVAWTADPDIDGDTLVARADTAMYESKRQGAGRPVLYSGSLAPARSDGLDDERWLRDALATGALEVHFQPILDLPSGRTVAYEALLRGRRDGRMVVAGEFIELAEQTGLIHEIGAWVLDETCRQAARLPRRPEQGGVRWTINVSPLQIAAPGFAATVERTLAAHGVDPAEIVLELTEHVSLGAGGEARDALGALAGLGVAIALDDFGTGWSSLELLRTLPVSMVKVDRSFTADLLVDATSRHLVETVLDLGRRLGLDVVIEGIETPGQRDLLVELGASTGQGWLYSPARPASSLFADFAVGV